MTKPRIIWVDDQKEREPNAQNLAYFIKADVQFESVENKEIEPIINKILESEEPDLVILDHSLDRAISNTFHRGSTLATYIREKWNRCPIVSCTHMDIENIPIRSLSNYDHVYELSKISTEYDSIKALIEGFNQLRSLKIDSYMSFVNSLLAPLVDHEKIIKVIPKEFKEYSENISSISLWYKWCRDVLFARPGFLYDELWVSTLLGLNNHGFTKVKEKFDRARYAGVFHQDSKPLWWKSTVLEILAQETKSFELPWIAGRLLSGDFDSDDYSRCYSTDEFFPETVAAIDDTPNSEWQPMKLMYTEIHPNLESRMFFEDLRVMSLPE